MQFFSKIAAVLSLLGALAIGIVAVYIADSRADVNAVDSPPIDSPWVISSAFVAQTPVKAQMLSGVWRGKWGRNQADCTIEITRVDGDVFYGVLSKEGTDVAFVGMLDPETRKVSFQETRVLKLGDTDEWLLGK